LLLHEAVWNKLLRTSLLSDSSLRTWRHVSRLMCSYSCLFQDHSTDSEHHFPNFCNRSLISRSWPPPNPLMIFRVLSLSQNLWNHSETRIPDRASFPWTVWSICLFHRVFSFVLNKTCYSLAAP
jgi:hypothetical protein